MIHDDPDTRVDYELEKLLRRKLGRTPTEQDRQEYWDLQFQADARADQERRRAEEERKQQRDREERERRRVLDERLHARDIQPEDYEPPRTVDALRAQVATKSAFCEQASIEGEPGRHVSIDFDLERTNLRRSAFRYVTFTARARLARADLTSSVFEDVVFASDADLKEVDFSETKLTDVRFEVGCELQGASFRFAKFRGRVAIEFDRNYIANTTFDQVRSDQWARLSASFAGIWQYINLTLSGAYFGMLLLKLYLFESMATLQAAILTAFPSLAETDVTRISVFDFVFGSGWISVAIAVLILVYQSLRLFLTTRIGPLIEGEKRSGYTPDRSSYTAYVRLSGIMTGLGVLVFALFAYEVWGLVTQQPLLIPTFLSR